MIGSLKDYDLGKFIKVDNDKDELLIKMMTAPVSEGGEGCQFTDLIKVALHQLKYLDNKFPCVQNKSCIDYLELALDAQERRTRDRQQRNVEGRNEV